MNKHFEHVLAPARVAGRLLKNRIISGPMTFHTSSNGERYPSEKAMRYFEARARAGVGLVTCAGIFVGLPPENGDACMWDVTAKTHVNRGWRNLPSVYTFTARNVRWK